uniref:Isoform 3 of LIM and calponin homology domains-containing protein 1 n=1 Tax=Mus musculus TaxID=10090 RepID=Q3UH68-3
MHKTCTIRSFIRDFYRILFTCARPSIMSDDAESTSMFDMRCEEEAAVLPHSRARQEQLQPEPPPEPAFAEAQKWIEQVTGRSFGDKDFRTGLENGILLCELLNAIKPGLVKKINRLPTPIAGLDNTILFLRGCKELGLKESQLFDPSDLQDTSNRVTVKNLDYSRKLKNVLVTIYWLGKAANSCASYGGTTLNLKEFEGLLAQMRKETDDIDSPKRSIRDSGYIDCWDSERSDSLSPPRHGREDGTSERRKSIKTYREIVQEKERRERELHEAYKNARSQEEAEGILQQYIERFTISEAVLERLEMPKILERSHSTEPNVSSFPNDPSPMKYLRQQSLPPPKFTATVETTIARTSVPESIASAGTGSPSKIITPNTVPMLTPRPYSQPKNSQEVLKTFKVDGKVSMNGEMAPGDEEGKEKEGPAAAAPGPSLTKSQMFEGVATVHDSPVQVKQGSNSIEINIKKPNSAPQELTAASEETESNGQEDEDGEERPGTGDLEPDSAEPQHFTTTVTRCSPTVALVEFSSNPQLKNEVPEQGQKKPEDEMSGKVELVLSQKVAKPKSPEPEATLTFPFLDKMPETNQLHLPNPSSQADSPSSEKSPGSTPFKFWAWDPEEERRRQEKWQQEQERLLQERYQKEQDKLKEEWEKAQKEVEEEERRYYEEERKIIEDTVVPFTISSSSADQLSTSLSVTEGSGTRNKMDLENCPDKENERRQKTPFQENDGDSLLKTREGGLPEEQSLTPSPSANPEISVSKGIHQDPQLEAEAGAPHCGTNPQPAQDPPRNQQIPNPPTSTSEDVKPKTLALEKTINHQMESPGERRKSISGKKLCSSCGLTLGKGAAMIIETLNLYFHIQCFRCGICKGQLGDAVSGTDVRIRNGLLNCTDCYMRSRSAGQPTTL